MMVEIVRSAARIVAGFLKQLGGRTLGDRSLEVTGRVDQLIGQAVLVSVRARSRGGRVGGFH